MDKRSGDVQGEVVKEVKAEKDNQGSNGDANEAGKDENHVNRVGVKTDAPNPPNPVPPKAVADGEAPASKEDKPGADPASVQENAGGEQPKDKAAAAAPAQNANQQVGVKDESNQAGVGPDVIKPADAVPAKNIPDASQVKDTVKDGDKSPPKQEVNNLIPKKEGVPAGNPAKPLDNSPGEQHIEPRAPPQVADSGAKDEH